MAIKAQNTSEELNLPLSGLENPDPLFLIHKKLISEVQAPDSSLKKSLELKRQQSSNKLPVLKIEEIKPISNKITPATGTAGLPTCIVASKHMIIIGSNLGVLTVFSHDGIELKSLKQKPLNSVICIDISDDEQWAVAGYFGGQLSLWDLRSGNCVRSSGNIFGSHVISCKFWKHNKNNVIAADVTGKVVTVEYGKSFLTTTISPYSILTGEAGVIISIEPLFSEPNWPHSTDTSVVVAIACVDRVLVYCLEPEVTILLGIERPEEIVEDFLPSISFKFGSGPGEDQPIDPILSIGWGNKVYLHKIKFASPEGIQLVGVYTMDSEIKNLQLLGYDLLLVIGHIREAIVLSTKGFSKGNDSPNKDCVLEENFVNKDLAVQAYIKDKNSKEKFTYNNTIHCCDRQVFILGNKQLHKARVLNWKECIINLSENGDWLEVLSLGIEFYQGRGTKAYAVPNNKEELKKTFESIVEDYVKASSISWDFKIANTIEFCVGVESTDFLFNFFFDYFIDKGEGSENLKLFIEIIEPFILNGEIISIPKIYLGKILSYYLTTQRPDMVEKIVLHINSSSLDPEYLYPVCEEYSLTSAYIYISISNQNFIKPIDFLYSILKEQLDLHKKKYFAYKLLWYIKLCLKGEKFPKGFIPTEQWNKLIVSLINRVLQADLLEVLVALDANSTLKVVWIAFQDLTPSQALELSKPPLIPSIISKLESVCTGPAFHYFALFSARLSGSQPDCISKPLAIKSLIYLMKPNTNRKIVQVASASIESYIKNTENINELITDLDDSIESKSKLLLKLLKTYNNYSVTELEELYKIAVNSPYTEVLIELLEQKKDYNKCFTAFLQCSNVEVRTKVFEWLGSNFKKLAGTELDSLKAQVLDSLNFLVDIDSDRTAKIVREFYHNEHHNIIHKLDNAPLLQMKYLGELLKLAGKEAIEEKLIILYVKLLCENQPKKVLSFLKSLEDYSLDECLSVCTVTEASAYLYERLGSIKNALELLLGTIDKKRKEIQKGIKNCEKIDFNEILENIENSVQLCVRNVARLDENENEDHWFSLLGKILETYIELAPYFQKNLDLETCIQQGIRLALENMIDHIDFKKIIAYIVTKYGSIPFKYFKENFIGILSRYSYQKTIIKKAIDLLCSDIKYMTQQLLVLRGRGVSSKSFNCSACSFPIVSDDLLKHRGEKFFMFVCGHAYHSRCLKQKICEVCKAEEIKKGNFLLLSNDKK
jgi:Golgi CORVET complex core vacuolar protein 8